MFGSKKRKEKREQFDRDIWGESMSAPQRNPGILKVEEKMDALPQDKRNQRYLMLTIAIIVVFAVCLLAGTLYTCSDHAPERNSSATSVATSSSSSSSSSATTSNEGALRRFLNLDAYKDLMSEETLTIFQEQTSAYLREQGVKDTDYIMCYSRIDHDGDSYTTYISCPDDTHFYKVTFSVANKSFNFEPLSSMPEGLPEINYKALELAQQQPAGTSVADTQTSSAPSSAQNATIYYNVTDVESLKTFMPTDAASSLAQAVSEYCNTKGKPVTTNQCLVVASSIANTSNGVAMTIDCTQADGNRFEVSAEWYTERGQFGMTI